MQLNIVINDKVRIGMKVDKKDTLLKILNKLRSENIVDKNLEINTIQLQNYKRDPQKIQNTIENLIQKEGETPKLFIMLPDTHFNSSIIQNRISQCKEKDVDGIDKLYDKMTKTLKKTLRMMQEKKFEDVLKLQENPQVNKELVNELCNYATELQKYSNLVAVYENIISICFISQKNNVGKVINQLKAKYDVGEQEQDKIKQTMEIVEKKIKTLKDQNSLLNKKIQESLKEKTKIKQQCLKAIREKIDQDNQLFRMKQELKKKEKQFQTMSSNEESLRQEAILQQEKSNAQIEKKNLIIQSKFKEIEALKTELQQQKQKYMYSCEMNQAQQKQLTLQNAQIYKLKSKYEYFQNLLQQKKKNSSKSLNIRTTLSLKNISVTHQNLIIQAIQKTMKKTIKESSILYQYQLHSKITTKCKGDGYCLKKNLLLLAKTSKDQIVGGFTNLSFRISNKYSDQQIKTNKAFIFSSVGQNLNVFGAKQGRRSVQYDEDYFIFGRQQLCIQKNSHKLSTTFKTEKQKYINFLDPDNKRYNFLTLQNNQNNIANKNNQQSVYENSIDLKSYTLIAIDFI